MRVTGPAEQDWNRLQRENREQQKIISNLLERMENIEKKERVGK